MKRLLSIGLVACMVLLSGWSIAAEETTQAQIGSAPLNPLYEDYLQLSESEREGTIPPPMYEIPAQGDYGVMTMSVLPSTYDLRNKNVVSAVRNQLNSGSCWAFAGLASLESNLAMQTGKKYQFSPRHLEYSQVYQMKDGVNPEAFYRLADSGGAPQMVESYLYRGVGPVAETKMPFQDSTDSLYLADVDLATSDVRLMDFLYLPYDTATQSRADIISGMKSALMNYGALDVNVQFRYEDYNADKYALYVKDSKTVNHAVSIVGWDDNFSRANFSVQPDMDGAWIVQNSWGSDWGNNGYFYLSYAQNVVMPAAVKRAQEGKNYDHVYYHDPLGFSKLIGFQDEQYLGNAYAANIFETQPGAQQLTEVTVATAALTGYQIYVNPNGDSLAETDLTLVDSGYLDGTGYHTITLDTPIPLNGTKFAIVVHYETPNVKYCVPVEARSSQNSYYAKVEAEPSTSYLATGLQSNAWTEISNEKNGYANCCIKAYTKNTASCAKVTFQTTPSHARVTVKKDGKVIKALPGGSYVLEPGTYTYSAQAMDYNDYAERSLTVKNTDVSSGKKITFSMTQGAAPPRIEPFQQEIVYRSRTAQTAEFQVDLGSKGAAANGIQKVMDEKGNALLQGRDYLFQNHTLSILSSYTDNIVLSDEDYAALEGPSRIFTVIFSDSAQTEVTIRLRLRYAALEVCANYVQADLDALRATNTTTQDDVLATARTAFVNPNVTVTCVAPLSITLSNGKKNGMIEGKLCLTDATTGNYLYCNVKLPIYPYVYDITLTDTNGTAVRQLTSAKTLNVSINGSSNGTAEPTHCAYIAVYSAAGKLTALQTVPMSQIKQTNGTVSGQVAMTIQPQSTVCVMVWDSNSLCPLSQTAVWQLQ